MMIMKNKGKIFKIMLILAPCLIGIAVVWYISSKAKKSAGSGSNVNNGGSGLQDLYGGNTGTQTSVNSSGCSFPLKSGSNNDCVKQLQQALGGLTVDGVFGPATQSRLQQLTGKTSISSASELNSVIGSLSNANSASIDDFARGSQADVLTLQYNSGKYTNWQATKASTLIGIMWPLTTTNGQKINLDNGQKISMATYNLIGKTNDNYLVLADFFGNYYKADPQALKLV